MNPSAFKITSPSAHGGRAHHLLAKPLVLRGLAEFSILQGRLCSMELALSVRFSYFQLPFYHLALISFASLSVESRIITSPFWAFPFTFLLLTLPFSGPSSILQRTWSIYPYTPV